MNLNPALLEGPPSDHTLGSSSLARRALGWTCRLLVGSLLAMTWLGAVVVFGWLSRWVQGQVLHGWWQRSPLRHGLSFERFQAENDQLPGPFRSLWLNLEVGFLGLLATCLLVGWGCLLMTVSWEYGWNASFHKDHEQALVGWTTGLLGAALFMAAMVYVPMAQVHQAVTGDFRAFFEFGFVWRLIQVRLGRYVLFAFLFLDIAVALENLKTIPTGLDDHLALFSNASDQQLLRFFQVYYLGCSLVLLLGLLATRLILLRLYRGAVLDVLRRGWVSREQLHPRLADWFTRLDLFPERVRNIRPGDAPAEPGSSGGRASWRAGGPGEPTASGSAGASPSQDNPFTGSERTSWKPQPGMRQLARRAGLLVVLLAIWFGFVAKVYVGEFFNYHPIVGFLNHPLIQAPCCNYTPAHLGKPMDESPPR